MEWALQGPRVSLQALPYAQNSASITIPDTSYVEASRKFLGSFELLSEFFFFLHMCTKLTSLQVQWSALIPATQVWNTNMETHLLLNKPTFQPILSSVSFLPLQIKLPIHSISKKLAANKHALMGLETLVSSGVNLSSMIRPA